MLTPLGKALRKLRIDRGWLLKDMADGAGVTASFLSGVETGRKSAPAALVTMVGKWAKLDANAIKELEEAAALSKKEFTIARVPGMTASDLHAAALLARFGELPQKDRQAIKDILERKLP
jgi:transcriptional regulator with XRE-family HTH domain